MLEGLGVPLHAETLHHGLRAFVAEGGEGDDLVECQGLEAEGQGSLCGFGGKAPAPERSGEAPADLDAGTAGQFGGGNVETDEADALCALPELGGPEAPARSSMPA